MAKFNTAKHFTSNKAFFILSGTELPTNQTQFNDGSAIPNASMYIYETTAEKPGIYILMSGLWIRIADSLDVATSDYTIEELQALFQTKFTQDFVVSLGSGKTLGKLLNGETAELTGKTLDEGIQYLGIEDIYPSYTIPTISISESQAAIGEVGQSLTNVLTATYGQNDAGAIVDIRILKDGVILGAAGTTSPLARNDTAVVRTITPIVYTAVVQYLAGLLKPVPPTNFPDDRTALVRQTNAPQAAASGFTSSGVSYGGIYPYFFGVSNVAPTADQSLINSGTKVVADSSGTITVSFGASAQYLWFAIPVTSTSKTSWFVTELNSGPIGGLTNLFGTEQVVEIDSPTALWNNIDYKFYLGNYQTTTGSDVYQLRN